MLNRLPVELIGVQAVGDLWDPTEFRPKFSFRELGQSDGQLGQLLTGSLDGRTV